MMKVEVYEVQSNELLAKELFIKYNHSTFYMGRESMEDYRIYKGLEISSELELSWIHEYQSELIKKCYSSESQVIFHDCFMKFCLSKSNYPTICNLNELIELMNFKKDKLDSFTKMRLAEDVLKLIVKALSNKGFGDSKIIIELILFAVDVLNNIIIEPIKVDSAYHISNSFSEETLLAENILSRSKSVLQEWSK